MSDSGGQAALVRAAVQRGRRLVRKTAWAIVSKSLGAATHVLPRQRQIVVNGFPAFEGNAVEVVRELQERYDGRITWIDAPSARELEGLGLTLKPNVRIAKYWSFAALYSYVVAELIFYTHGLYGNPRLASSRTVVNLWHGHGIKRVDYPGYATHLVVPTKMHAKTRAAAFRVDRANVLIAMPPRTARLQNPTGIETLKKLGLGERPFVIWMPTYRKSKVKEGANEGWVTSVEEVAGVSATVAIAKGLDTLRARGIDVVVQAHPADAARRHISGAINITAAQLTDAETTLYNLLGASAGLITDYSSVWFEYMITKHPIAFFMPDKADYTASRGVVPTDALNWLPGPELLNDDDFNALADELLSGRHFESLQARSSGHFGLAGDWSAQGSVLSELRRRGLIRLLD